MTTTKTFFRGTCERGHTTDYPYESPFALCEEVESGPAVLWRCAADCYGLKRNCGGKLVKFQMLIRDSSNDPMENEGAMTGRILDANDIENFKAFYSLGKRDFWPPMEAVVRDIKCLLKTVDALQADFEHAMQQNKGLAEDLGVATVERNEARKERNRFRTQLQALCPHGVTFDSTPAVCAGCGKELTR